MPLPEIMRERQKVTPEIKKRIRVLIGMGVTQRDIAMRLGVSLATVWKYSKDANIEAANERTKRWREAKRLTPEQKAKKREELERRKVERVLKEPAPVDRSNAVPTGRNGIKTAVPLVRELFIEMWRKKMLIADVAKAAKMPAQTLSLWRAGHSAPTLSLFLDVARIVGFDVQLVAIKQENPDGVQTD